MHTAFCRACRLAPLLLPAALLPACKSTDIPKVPGVTPYRMVIQQGNFISQEMVAQLKPGMTREQVRFILGTPLVTDIFHADRWDYIFYRELANGKREQRNLSVIFEKDRLARVIGDLMPAEGAAPQATGFDPAVKPDTKPAAKPAAEAPKPPAGAAKAADAPKPAAENWEPTRQNWSTAAPAPENKPAPAAGDEPKKADEKKAEEAKPAEAAKEEPGFFTRMLEKIGL
jgi:outer membrane protein assembly factor BamE